MKTHEQQHQNTLRGAIVATLVGMVFAATAQAQSVQQPAGLKWQSMHEIVFNSIHFSSTGTDEERSLLAKIWEKELQGTEKNPINGSLLPSFAVIGMVEHHGEKLVFSMYDRAGSACISPGNGKGMVNMFATCPLRIVKISANGQSTEQNLATNFCMLYGDDPHNPRAKNHNEYAFDEYSGIVYLRIVQYGKVVPECNRAIRIFKD